MNSAISDHSAEIIARAPGKAVLLGEYAVLDGAPALSMAVNRYARVTLRSCGSDACQVTAPQLGIDPVPFSLTAQGDIRWQVDAPGWSELQRTAELLGYLHARASRRFGSAGPFQLHIDTSELYLPAGKSGQAQPVKLGLGSSSAVAVALDAVLRRFFGGQAETGLTTRALNRLLEPYRRGQDGRGKRDAEPYGRNAAGDRGSDGGHGRTPSPRRPDGEAQLAFRLTNSLNGFHE